MSVNASVRNTIFTGNSANVTQCFHDGTDRIFLRDV